MKWFQIVWIVLAVISIVCSFIMDGQPKTGRHNFAWDLFGIAFNFWLLYFGGFWAGLIN